MTDTWLPRFYERSALFDPLRESAAALPHAAWPDCADFQHALDARVGTIKSGGDVPLRFVEDGGRAPAAFEDRYEPRIFLRGEIRCRRRNWHDLFNALVWLTFPRAKAALNLRHYRELSARRARVRANRSPVEDALTLFDESGLIVVSADRSLTRELDAFAWKTLFWEKRARVAAAMRFYVFGHAIYEKALAPYPGITGRALCFEAGPDFMDRPLAAQIEWLDEALAARLCDPATMRATRELAPVPVLGVPGWHAPGVDAGYYEDARYFRSRRRD